MPSVVKRISEIKQPRAGYLPVSNLIIDQLEDDEIIFNTLENVSPIIVGLAVDYLTRFMYTGDLSNSFVVPLLSLDILRHSNHKDKDILVRMGVKYLNSIKGLDDESIIYACKLVSIDSIYRAGYFPTIIFDDINPDNITISHIRTLVTRTLKFFSKDNQIIKYGMVFDGGYTDKVTTGDADFMTSDTLWDLKVSQKEPTNKYTLQLAVYWRLGLHSNNPEPYKKLRFLGIYNPRLNKVYRYDLLKISDQTIEDIDYEVIGYDIRNLNKKKKSFLKNRETILNLLKASELVFPNVSALNDNDFALVSSLQSEEEIRRVLYLIQQMYAISINIENCFSKDKNKYDKYNKSYQLLRNLKTNNEEDTREKLLAFIKLYKQIFEIDDE